MALYHFDEGEGNEAHDACGDPELMLRAEKALWGSRPGFGTTARFTRRADDANILVGPTNNDKLHLRTCTQEWTIEAWVRYTGPGGQESGRTYGNICGTEDEGLGLPVGMRGGWNFHLYSFSGQGTLQDGVVPVARFMGSVRGRDPNHDTSGQLFSSYPSGGWTSADQSTITDSEWHHVAWQFRYLDQTHFFFLDGQLIANVQLPLPGKLQGKVINDAENVGVPFVIGGFRHSQDPPFHLEYGSFEGEIDEVRISSIMRYPVAEHLTILRQELPVADLQAHYSVQLSADAAQGDVHWELAEGQLPEGLTLDGVSGLLHGTPSAAIDQQSFALRAMDSGGEVDENAFHLSVQPGRISTESLPPAFAGVEYVTAMKAEHMAEPVRWTLLSGALPEGMHLESGTGELTGLPTSPGVATFRVEAVDAGGLNYQTDLTLKVLPATLHVIGPDEQTVVLYDWQGSNGRLIRDIVGDEELTLTWTNMGGDRRVSWPGREGRFPQDTGHGEHGFVGPQHSDKLDLRTCTAEWTVEAWVRRGGAVPGVWGQAGQAQPAIRLWAHLRHLLQHGTRRVGALPV